MPASNWNTNSHSHSMASPLTRALACMGALELELETPDMPLEQPAYRLQQDARQTSYASGESQPAATGTENLVLRT